MSRLRQHVYAIDAGSVKCIFGPNFDDVRRELQESFTAGEQTVLIKRLKADPVAPELIDDLLSGLAGAARAMWPAWYGQAEFGVVHDPRRVGAALRRRLDGMVAQMPKLSVNWAARAIKAVSLGRSPALPQFARETQLQQLGLAVSGVGLTIVIVLDGTEQTDAGLENLVHAAEWLARQGELAVALVIPATLADRSALERVMFGAVFPSRRAGRLGWDDEPPENGGGSDTATADLIEAEDIWLWPALGRPPSRGPGLPRRDDDEGILLSRSNH